MAKIKRKLKENMYVQLFWEFFTLGLFTIGGGMAMVGLMEDRLTNKRGWMTSEEALDCIAISQSLPGVIAVNMSVYIGYKKRGIRGALISWFGMVLPSFLIIIGIAVILGKIHENPYIQGALTGIRAAVTGLIAYTLWKMGKELFRPKKSTLEKEDKRIRESNFRREKRKGEKIVGFNIGICLATFVAITFFKINAAWVILSVIPAGIGYFVLFIKKEKVGADK